MIRAELEGAPDAVARSLLGAHLVVGDVVARLVEVEAYGGADDPASHAFRGKRSANRTMFGPAGHLYVYLSHGIHTCANVTCGPEDVANAVLFRAVQVLEGIELVRARRGRDVPKDRLVGPGRLCQGMGILRSHDGVDLLDPSSPVRIEGGSGDELGGTIVAGPRVGLTKEVDRPWRFRVVEPREPPGRDLRL
jgi:DNA-3-methyladenine glycosylase